MNEQSVKDLVASYGHLETYPCCWEIENTGNKKYVWIIEPPFFPERHDYKADFLNKHISVKNKFSIHYTGHRNPRRQGYFSGDIICYLANFEYRTDTPMNGLISKITVIQRNGSISSESEWMNCKSGSKYGYLSNQSREYWELDAKGFMIPNFSLMVPGRVQVNYKDCIIVIIEFLNTLSLNIPPAISEEQEHQNAALQLTSQLYESKDSADVQMVVNGTQLMAHKAILAARSPVFKTMMETNMAEKKSSVIEIDDYEPEIIEEMLKYIYTGKADLVNHAEQLLSCSDKYDIKGLMDLSQNYLAKNISAVGFVKIFELLQLYGERVPIFKKSAEEYFKMNENSLIESDEFQTMVRLHSKELLDFYMSRKRKREED